MPRLHGYRERSHQPLWDTVILEVPVTDAQWFLPAETLRFPVHLPIVTERKSAAITACANPVGWPLVLHHGWHQLVENAPV